MYTTLEALRGEGEDKDSTRVRGGTAMIFSMWGKMHTMERKISHGGSGYLD